MCVCVCVCVLYVLILPTMLSEMVVCIAFHHFAWWYHSDNRQISITGSYTI